MFKEIVLFVIFQVQITTVDLFAIEPTLNDETANKANTPTKIYYEYTQRSFPEDFDNTLKKCKKCVCPYCKSSIKKNLTKFREHLDLSNKEVNQSHIKHFPWGFPKTSSLTSDVILTQRDYVTAYSLEFHVPLWVGYKLTKEKLSKNKVKRANCFRRDIRLDEEEGSLCSDYRRSGFDRGHLAPSADFLSSAEAGQDTFVLSNMAPQYPAFNRHGSWIFMEKLTRKLVKRYGSLQVISGSIYDIDNNGEKDSDCQDQRWVKNNTDSVAIPTHFYKILTKCKSRNKDISQCCYKHLDTLAFVLPHAKDRVVCKKCSMFDYLKNHTATIRDVEKLTGVNFFSAIPSNVQDKMEMKLNKKIWRH